MYLQSTAHQFVAMCNQLQNFEVMRTMYAPTLVSVEGDRHATQGQQPVIRKSEIWQSNNTIHSEQARGPFFNGPNHFAIHFPCEIRHKGTGKRETIEEV